MNALILTITMTVTAQNYTFNDHHSLVSTMPWGTGLESCEFMAKEIEAEAGKEFVEFLGLTDRTHTVKISAVCAPR
jgi:hypothetical protein